MHIVRTRSEMKRLPANEGEFCKVTVNRRDRIYRYTDGNWIEKVYFSNIEAQLVLGITEWQVRDWMHRFRMVKIDYKNLLLLEEIGALRKQGLTFRGIKQLMGNENKNYKGSSVRQN